MVTVVRMRRIRDRVMGTLSEAVTQSVVVVRMRINLVQSERSLQGGGGQKTRGACKKSVNIVHLSLFLPLFTFFFIYFLFLWNF